MLTRQNRIALHMVDATATELPRTRTRHPPLLPWWMKGALLVLFVPPERKARNGTRERRKPNFETHWERGS